MPAIIGWPRLKLFQNPKKVSSASIKARKSWPSGRRSFTREKNGKRGSLVRLSPCTNNPRSYLSSVSFGCSSIAYTQGLDPSDCRVNTIDARRQRPAYYGVMQQLNGELGLK